MTVRVVDDEADVRLLFERRFCREVRGGKLQIECCFSGEQALAYSSEHASQAELVLSDINMPGMGGLEILKHIREQSNAPVPQVIILTPTATTKPGSRSCPLA